MKAYLYKKLLTKQESYQFLQESYYKLREEDGKVLICCWIVDEEHAKNVGWIPCTKADIKRFKDLYTEKPLNELDEIAIRSATKAGFDRVKEKMGYSSTQ